MSCSLDPSTGSTSPLRHQQTRTRQERPDGHYVYPIVSSFSTWSFPHLLFDPDAPMPDTAFRTHLRSRWHVTASSEPSSSTNPTAVDAPVQQPLQMDQTSASGLSAAVHNRDRNQCRISGRHHFCETAHLVPCREEEWWNANDMTAYLAPTSESFGISSSANALLLRVDLHRAFDEPCFSIVPKYEDGDGSVAGAGGMVPHFTSALHSQLAAEFHDREMHYITGVGIAFLFARFAWTVIPSVHRFLKMFVARRVLVVDPISESRRTESLGGAVCNLLAKEASKSKSRSQSPKKRARSDLDSVGEDGEDTDLEDEEDEREAKRSRLDRFLQEGDWRWRREGSMEGDNAHGMDGIDEVGDHEGGNGHAIIQEDSITEGSSFIALTPPSLITSFKTGSLSVTTSEEGSHGKSRPEASTGLSLAREPQHCLASIGRNGSPKATVDSDGRRRREILSMP